MAYKLGLMELTGDNPMDPSCWVQHEDPILNIGGAGHASFLETRDGEHVIFYHKKTQNEDRWSDRVLKQQRFEFDAVTGLPILMPAEVEVVTLMPRVPQTVGFSNVA